MAYRRRRKLNFKPRFFALIALVVVVLTVALVCILMRGKGELRDGSMVLDSTNKVVIIRDESSVAAERYSRVSFHVAEGSTVAAGDVLATIYKWGFSDDLTQSLISTRAQILEAQKGLLSGVTNAELASLELQIQQKLSEIRAAVMGSGEGDAYVLEQELDALLSQRMSYLRELVQPNESLTSLYSTETTRTNQIAEYGESITAPISGTVSFYLDGYEQVLNAEKMDTINAALISSTAKNGSATTGTVENMACRIVNEEHWYIAFVTDQSAAWRLVEGESYTVVFDGYADKPFVGTALAPVSSDSGVLNLIEFNTNIQELINIRTLSAQVRLEATGLRIPLSAISVTDGAPGITVDSNAGTYRVQVEVLAVDEEGEEAIIRSADESAQLQAGMRYIEG